MAAHTGPARGGGRLKRNVGAFGAPPTPRLPLRHPPPPRDGSDPPHTSTIRSRREGARAPRGAPRRKHRPPAEPSTAYRQWRRAASDRRGGGGGVGGGRCRGRARRVLRARGAYTPPREGGRKQRTPKTGGGLSPTGRAAPLWHHGHDRRASAAGVVLQRHPPVHKRPVLAVARRRWWLARRHRDTPPPPAQRCRDDGGGRRRSSTAPPLLPLESGRAPHRTLRQRLARSGDVLAAGGSRAPFHLSFLTCAQVVQDRGCGAPNSGNRWVPVCALDICFSIERQLPSSFISRHWRCVRRQSAGPLHTKSQRPHSSQFVRASNSGPDQPRGGPPSGRKTRGHHIHA